MGKRLANSVAALVALVMLMPATAWAQGTTGTIRGKIIDQTSSDPLAAVNVFLLETDGTVTQMGAFTNAEGDYVIINVPPGRYTIRSTMMGYKTYEVEELLVTVGVSTRQDFTMEATVLDVGEVVTVTAERDMIQRDVTATQQSYTIEEMERMAVTTTTDILSLQTNAITLADNFMDDIPGYYDRGLEQVHMRGGRNAEVAFMIDGMQVTNLVFGGQAASVSPFSLSEMVVMAGGMSAEFGNAMSGVVNMVTREGGTRYDANVEVNSSEFTGQVRDDVRNNTRMQGYFGGPVPLIPKFTFFASGSVSSGRTTSLLRDNDVFDWQVNPYDYSTLNPEIDYGGLPEDPLLFDPSIHNPYYPQYGSDDRRIHGVDIVSGWIGLGYNNSWDGMLNLTYKLTPQMKLNMQGSLNGRWSNPYTWQWRHAMLWGWPEWAQDYWLFGAPNYNAYDQWGNLIGDPGADGNPRHVQSSALLDFQNEKNELVNENWRLAFVWTHQMSQSTFYSVRGAYYDYNRTMRVNRFVNQEGWIAREDHLYRLLEEDPTSPTYNQPLPPLWAPWDPMNKVELLWIIGGYETGLGSEPRVLYDDYYPDGVDTRTYGYYGYSSSGAGLAYEGSDRYWTDQLDITRSLKGDITSQVTTHHQLKAGAQYNALLLDMWDIQFPWSSSPSHSRYVQHPWEFGAYLQDKIEYDFMILNVGVRYDAAAAGEVKYWIDPRIPVHPDTTMTDEERLIVLPREYDNPPVTVGRTNTSLAPRFGVSHPVTDQAVLYFNYGMYYQKPIYRNVYRVNRIDRGNAITGNPNLEHEKTSQYEFGYKHQFTEIYALEVTMWAKDTSNLVGTERVPAWFQGAANPYEYTVAINYDYSTSRGVDLSLRKRYSNMWSARVNYSYMTTAANRDDPWQGYRDGGEGTLERSPKRPRKVGWDQPHRFSASVSLQVPRGAGPAVLGIRPFERMSASLIYRANMGRPYTPRNVMGVDLEQNSGRRPWTFQVDLRLYRDFETLGLRYSLFADIRNLMDRRNVTSVYSRTGKADDPGPDATSYSDNYDRFHYYGTPRTINVGMRIYF